MTESPKLNSAALSCPDVSAGSAAETPPNGADVASPARPEPASEFEALLHSGFASLRFPPRLEAAFQQGQAGERLHMLRISCLLTMILSAGMLLADWLMVPDRFGSALSLRLLVVAPLLGMSAMALPRLPASWREWVGLVNSLLPALTLTHLCVSSEDGLAQAYLVAMSLTLLFNGGVTRVRFWQAVVAACLVLSVFGLATAQMHRLNVPVTVGTCLIMVSTAVFTLYGSYRQELEERKNWLMQQHELLLLRRLEQGNRQLEQLTRFDPLTEIANRRHFDEFLAQLWTRAEQAGHEVSLLMMDIDHFKLYNDHYGHPAGDACLKQIAAVMHRHLRRPGDLLARFGGEEFIAVLNRATAPEAVAAGERVRAAVWQLAYPHEQAPGTGRITVSIGVASLRANEPGASTTRLTAMADEALYRAKSNGRNQVYALGSQ